MERIHLATGKLGWNGDERRMDRYGTIRLWSDDEQETIPFPVPAGLEGTKGRLWAIVRASRESGHCGDLHRGIRPSKPEVGEVLLLGEGYLFHERLDPEIPRERGEHQRKDDQMARDFARQFGLLNEGADGFLVKSEAYDMVGLRPEDGRPDDWLDPRMLYRCHDQTVDIYFEPTDAR